jgi:hypothetical protein
MKTLLQHFQIAPEKRDLTWIKSALQTAISLEHATLPLYISATYSLKVQNFTAYNLIRSIAMEEMVHMAAVCNILAAIGGTPQIKNLDPGYPSHGLPGGAEPDLFVCLAALSKPQLENFMRLEAPVSLIDDKYAHEKYESISNFYAAIRAAIVDNTDVLRAAVKTGGKSNQVGDNIGFSTIVWSDTTDCIVSVLAAIDSITSQGEGLVENVFHADGSSEAEESHFARFAQIYYKAQLTEPHSRVQPTRETLKDFFQGYKIPFPEVTNTLAVPADGYEKLLAFDPDRDAVTKALVAFDTGYSQMLAGLDESWNGDPAKWWPTLGGAVELMAKLRVFACFNLMKHQVPEDLIAKLHTIYSREEVEVMSKYTRLDQPVFYGPRFRNLNLAV